MNLHDTRRSRISLVSRPTATAITQDFASVWPEVAGRLAAMLRRRGVNTHDADEIVQETAARAFSTAVPYTDADDLFRWTSVVGWRLAIDLRRRNVRLSDDEVPERADTIDVAIAAEHRIVLSAVQRRLTELSARDQEVLLSSFDDKPVRNRVESVRLAVARHRARNRLRALLDGLAAPVLGLWARRSRQWSAPMEAIGYAAAPAAACFVLSIAAFTAPAPVATNPPPRATSVVVASAPHPSVPLSAAPSGVQDESRLGGSRSANQPSAVVPPSGIRVDQPDGGQADAGIRPKTDSDHLACLQAPPAAGIPEACVDQPVMLGVSPP